MKKTFIYCLAFLLLLSCNSKKEDGKGTKKTKKGEYTITKAGIGELKIHMKQDEVEKLLNQKFVFETDKEAPHYWQDTVTAKYKELPVTLVFFRQSYDDDSSWMDLVSISTSSPLCRTETGLGIGDEKSDIFPLYDDNPITMMPDYEQINDSTWDESKTKFSVYVRDDKYDSELVFRLVNKKIAALEAAVIMGD